MFDHIYLTGFGKFPGVQINPTELIVKHAKSLSNELVSVQVLDVTTSAVDYYVNKIKEQIKGKEGKKILFLHLGVGSIGAYFLQNYCYNNKNFRIPDNDGYSAENELITKEYDLQHRLSTSLELDNLAKYLEKQGFKNRISSDPGRYLCNYIYFSSLHELKRLDQSYSSLFIHVPSHDAYFSPQKNQQLIESLIKYFLSHKAISNLTAENMKQQKK